jgi:hypothetical protein
MMKEPNEVPKSSAWHLTGLGLAIFLGVVVAAVAVAQANVVRPTLGDIVSIKAGADVPGTLRTDIEVGRLDANGQPSGSCVLQSDVIAQEGGSLVVEATRIADPTSYVVHWAGAHTSIGPSDCGPGADLLLSENALQHLAQVAGGFGVDQTQASGALSATPLPAVAN